MILTTTDGVDGATVAQYLGIVSGDTVLGTNIFSDFFASIRDIVGGRSGSYEEKLQAAKDTALQEMAARAQALGADAVIGIDLDYHSIGGDSKTLLMVVANGTAVKLAR
ncbi:MAG: YbjQ family protein [Rhodospirillaceae bacterium]|nr:YbjQ family protein [Rhodospirillales bacterium]